MNVYLKCLKIKGFTLLEVMISAVILTVSLLGVAGVYGFSSKFSFEAKEYSQVINIVNDIFGKIKINKEAWINHAFKNPDEMHYLLILNSSKPNKKGHYSSCQVGVDKCENYSMVDLDIQGFESHLMSAVPSSHSYVCIQLEKNNLTEVVNASVNINWVVENESESEQNISSLENCDASNKKVKNYHVTTVL